MEKLQNTPELKGIAKLKALAQNGVYTHSSKFHADDVLSAALLEICWITKIDDIQRKNDVTNVSENALVFDVWMGAFDHHQKEKRTRENGTAYAALGLLWETIGKEYFLQQGLTEEQATKAQKIVDENFIQKIDLTDNNGQAKYPNGIAYFVSKYDIDDDFYGLAKHLKPMFKNYLQNVGKQVKYENDHFGVYENIDEVKKKFKKYLMDCGENSKMLIDGKQFWKGIQGYRKKIQNILDTTDNGALLELYKVKGNNKEINHLKQKAIMSENLESEKRKIVTEIVQWSKNDYFVNMDDVKDKYGKDFEIKYHQTLFLPATLFKDTHIRYTIAQDPRDDNKKQYNINSVDSAKYPIDAENGKEWCTFCHPWKFLATFETKDKALQYVQKMLNESQTTE